MNGKVLLVVEDGTEYVEAFRRLAGAGSVTELVRAGDADEAKRILAVRRVDGVFLDVVFDRTPPEKLCGDSARGAENLARQQGFYLAAELAELLPEGCRVVIAWDFTGEPGRLDALRKRVPSLQGVDEGTPLSRVLASLIRD